jgi:hypothetical protein
MLSAGGVRRVPSSIESLPPTALLREAEKKIIKCTGPKSWRNAAVLAKGAL